MANLQKTTRKFTITTQDTYIIGDADLSFVGTIAVHLVSSSFSGTIRVKARARGKTADDDTVAFVQVPYLKRFLNGSVADDSIVSADITDTSLILIPASGQSIALDCTTFNSGTMTAYVHKLQGAAA